MNTEQIPQRDGRRDLRVAYALCAALLVVNVVQALAYQHQRTTFRAELDSPTRPENLCGSTRVIASEQNEHLQNLTHELASAVLDLAQCRTEQISSPPH